LGLELKPSGALFVERARVWEKLGNLPRAIRSATRAVALRPSLEHRLLKARLQSWWRDYPGAARELGRCLELAPRDPELILERSRALSAGGRLGLALRDARRAAGLSPSDPAARLRVPELLLARGETRAALREIRSLQGGAQREELGRLAFLTAYALARQGKWHAAGRAFQKATRPGGGPSSRKAAFYALVCRVAAGARPARPASRGEVFLVGLGVNPPYSASLQALRVLASCAVVFNNVWGEEMFEILRLLSPDCRPMAYHQRDDEGRLAETVLAQARRGRRAAFVTRGHPILYGGLGTEILRRGRSRGIAVRCLPAVNSADLWTSRQGHRGDRLGGLQALDLRPVSRDLGLLNPTVAQVLFRVPELGPRTLRKLFGSLLDAEGTARTVLAQDHQEGGEPWAVGKRDLQENEARLRAASMVYIPAGAL